MTVERQEKMSHSFCHDYSTDIIFLVNTSLKSLVEKVILSALMFLTYVNIIWMQPTNFGLAGMESMFLNVDTLTAISFSNAGFLIAYLGHLFVIKNGIVHLEMMRAPSFALTTKIVNPCSNVKDLFFVFLLE